MSELPATGAREPRQPTLSVVIPSWRDAGNLARLVPAITTLGLKEIIIVDASADAATEQLALQHGAILLKCSAPNRGAQMNVGAMFASGDVLLFQHADTELTAAHVAALRAAVDEGEIIGGAFYRKFDRRHPLLQPFEGVARFLARHGGTLYGDQSIFVRREAFLQLQGFAKIPLMEDMEFSKRLRAAGKIAVLDPPIRSSSRHHERQGAWRRTLQNGLFIVLYKCGVSPVRLHEWYYRGATNAAAEPLRS
ncbi:MAG: TIGR04283 family arsenosugar biosynthesis glycosyltransferase [Verrucomicrobiota bacterium]|nr:TIGR04283 family arsenosugar biosynthesis glycosyltransferase [Verrucomicrobiota bacterium]